VDAPAGEADDDIESDVDLGGDGRQHGWLARARPSARPSAHPSAHPFARPSGDPSDRRTSRSAARANATLDRARLPLTVLRRGAGPLFLLVGGDGGGSGSLALRRLARELDPATLAGTVVIVPDAPREAIGAIVRSLGGTADTLLEVADAPPGIGFSPMAAIVTDTTDDVRARSEAAMIAFGAPESVRFASVLAPGALDDGSATGAAHVVATIDGGVPIAEAIDVALVGCRNVLAAGGALDAPLALRATRTLAVRDANACLHAPTHGLLELRAGPGRQVYRGDPLALVVDPTRNGTEPVVVRVPYDGVVLAARTGVHVRCGDCIAIVADEMPR